MKGELLELASRFNVSGSDTLIAPSAYIEAIICRR
jgi:hypothetical protein